MDSLNELKHYFESLQLPEWKSQGHLRNGGQAIGMEVRNEKTGQTGFFRVLKKPTEVDKKRFHRELKFLIDPEFQHPNIIKVLHSPKSDKEFWYISAKGDSFKDWWVQVTDKKSTDEIFTVAMNVIRQLADGLKKFHSVKAVHRDIKVDNIVVRDGRPVLIDFGILFDPEDERVTPEDSATGNARFSPDQMMNRLEEVPPWIDIFHLAQLLIWMVAEKSAKSHWSRPLHWLYVRYPKDLSEKKAKVMRALTALCSSFYTSPKDASELSLLVDSLLVDKIENNMDEIIRGILEGVQSKKVSEKEKYALDLETLQNEFGTIKILEDKINTALRSSAERLAEHLPVQIYQYQKVDFYESQILPDKYLFKADDAHDPYSFPCLGITFGEGKPDSFALTTYINMRLPSRRADYKMAVGEEFLNFSLRFTFWGPQNFNEAGLNTYHHIYFNRNGTDILVAYNDYKGELTIGGFLEFATALMSNNKAWELVTSS
jgi:serine/threonine protein kinase